MNAGLGIAPLVNLSMSPLKSALCCVLPSLALCCLPLGFAATSCFALSALGAWSMHGCSSASISSQPHALLQEASVCSRAVPSGALWPEGTKHLALASLTLHLNFKY